MSNPRPALAPRPDALDELDERDWHQPPALRSPVGARDAGARAASDAEQIRAGRLRTLFSVAGVASLGSGVLGMVLSLLTMAGGLQEVMIGAFGFVAGAILLGNGLVVLALAAVRTPRGPSALASARMPMPGDTFRTVVGVLAALCLLAGIGGMGLCFLLFAVADTLGIIAGGSGFVAGALLVQAGGIAGATIALERPER